MDEKMLIAHALLVENQQQPLSRRTVYTLALSDHACMLDAVLEGKMKVLVAHSCLTLCDPMDCNLPGSSVPGILLARILEFLLGKFQRVGQD